MGLLQPDISLLLWQVLFMGYLIGLVFALIRLGMNPQPWSKKWPLLILLVFLPLGLFFYPAAYRSLFKG